MKRKQRRHRNSGHAQPEQSVAMNTDERQPQEQQAQNDHPRHAEQNEVPFPTTEARYGWRLNRELSIFDGILAVTAILGLGFLGFQSCQLKRTNDLTRQSVELSRQQFELAERPWLSADVTAVEPLTFDDTTGNGSIGIEVLLKNTGRSVAMNVRVASYMMGDLITPVDAVAMQERLCAQLQTDDLLGYTVFPGGVEKTTTRVLVRQAEIEAASRRLEGAAASDAVARVWRGRILPSLVTCIKYRSGVSLASKYYQTRYLFIIGEPTDDISYVGSIIYPRGIIGSRLWPVFYGRYAD